MLDNADGVLTTLDLKGYQGVISFGLTTSVGDEYSAVPTLWVVGQQLHSWPGRLVCSLSLAGYPNTLDADRANASYTPTTADIKTVKDLLTEVLKATLPLRANSTAYALDDLVIPATSNGYTYKCTTAGTSAGSPPTWPTAIGATVADGTVVWTNVGTELTVYSHALFYNPIFDSEDGIIDTFMPKDAFRIYLNSSRLDAIKELLGYTKCVMRIVDTGQAHIFVPKTSLSGSTWVANTAYALRDYVQPTSPNNNWTYRCITAGVSHATAEPTWPTTAGGTVIDGSVVWEAETFDYEYKLAVADEHTFFAKSQRQRLVVPNYIVVSSEPHHIPQYTGFAEETESSALLPKRAYHNVRLSSNAQATTIAKAILAQLQLGAQGGAASVPLNVGAEVYDYVKVTDSRENDFRIGNIGYLNRRYQRGTWEMDFGFGGMGGYRGFLTEGQMGSEFSPTEVIEPEKIKKVLDEALEALNAHRQSILDIKDKLSPILARLVPESADSILQSLLTTRGDIIYRGVERAERLGGDSGVGFNFLRSRGNLAGPEWVDIQALVDEWTGATSRSIIPPMLNIPSIPVISIPTAVGALATAVSNTSALTVPAIPTVAVPTVVAATATPGVVSTPLTVPTIPTITAAATIMP